MFAKVKERLDTAGLKNGTGIAGAGRPASGGDRPMPSIIGPDMTVMGNLETPGEIHVEGRIAGDVTCAKLTVGATGSVRGIISAESVRVHGRVEGAIHASEVYLLSGSQVQGDIVQSILEIAPGALFEGAIRRRDAVTVACAVPALEAPASPPEPITETVSEAESDPDAPLELVTEATGDDTGETDDATGTDEVTPPTDGASPPSERSGHERHRHRDRAAQTR